MSIAIRQSIHFSPVDEAELDEALRMAVNVGGPNEYHLVEQFNRLLEAEIAEINRRAVTA
ncbi:MAG TPA: hypothetical protein VK574_07650 [Terracidiphilus sp.]|nr:hypothetical protein [Terracidiphilus sp.]